jgi:hypothetical protein
MQNIIKDSYWKGKTIPVTVTNTGTVDVDNVDETCFVSTCLDGHFHKTSKAQNIPTGATGYVHCNATNTLYAIRDFGAGDRDTASAGTAIKMTVTVLRKGKVNKGIHRF